MGKSCETKSSYKTKENALASANHQKMVNDLNFYIYQCPKCGNWHLAPEADRIHEKQSYCTDSYGDGKKCYRTIEDAYKVMQKQSPSLSTYYCRICDGWHLTHK